MNLLPFIRFLCRNASGLPNNTALESVVECWFHDHDDIAVIDLSLPDTPSELTV